MLSDCRPPLAMRLLLRERALFVPVLLVLALTPAAADDVSEVRLKALEEALMRDTEETFDGGSDQAHHRDKRQLFGNRRRNRNQNLFPGRNGEHDIYTSS